MARGTRYLASVCLSKWYRFLTETTFPSEKRRLEGHEAESVDPRVVAAFASEITRSLIAANEVGRVNTAINDLWKFSKAMKSRYGAPNKLRASIEFTRDVGVEVVERANIDLLNERLRDDS